MLGMGFSFWIKPLSDFYWEKAMDLDKSLQRNITKTLGIKKTIVFPYTDYTKIMTLCIAFSAYT